MGNKYSPPSSGTPEGTAVLSTGEAGGTKFLREDGDGTCSWQTPAGGGGGSERITISWDTEEDINKQSAPGGGTLTAATGLLRLTATAANNGGIHQSPATASNPSTTVPLFDDSPSITGYFYYKSPTTGDGVAYGMVVGQSRSVFPGADGVQTFKHVGWEWVTVSGASTSHNTNANGATQTKSADVGIAEGDKNLVRVIQDGATDSKLYVNNTLENTSSTNLPSGNWDGSSATVAIIGILNTAADATARSMEFRWPVISFGGE